MYIRVKERKYVEELQDLDDIPVPYKKIKEWLFELTKQTNQILGDNENHSMHCTYCKQNHTLDRHVKINELITCPHCGNTYKFHRTKYSHTSMSDHIDFIVLQKINETIYSRYFEGVKRINYGENDYDVYFRECMRKRIDNDWTLRYSQAAGKMIPNSTGYEYSGWLYHDGVKEMFEDTEYKYSAIEYIAGNAVDIRPFEYLQSSLYMPNKERLAKMGFHKLAVEYNNRYYYRAEIDAKLKLLRTLPKGKYEMLRSVDCTFDELKIAIKCDCATEEELYQAKRTRLAEYYRELLKYISRAKLFKYIADINRASDYRDYLSWCKELGENMTDKKVLFPKKFKKAHDEKMSLIENIRNQNVSNSIKAYAQKLLKYFYRNEKYLIKPAESQEELIKESESLNHCVRTYAERMAKKETAIFVVREAKKPDEPLVTLELRKKEIIQVRARNNTMPQTKVQQFIKQWEKQFELSGY